MAKSVPAILDELTQGLQKLREAFTEMAVRQTPTVAPEETNDLKKILASVERQVIERVMRSVKGNQSRDSTFSGSSDGIGPGSNASGSDTQAVLGAVSRPVRRPGHGCFMVREGEASP